MDSNHDIVPTLRMFDGVMTGLAADEIERLRKRVAELKADARVGLTAEQREAIIEECAKVCHKIADRAAKWHGDEYSSGGVSAGFECRNAIRALKNAPTSDKGD